MFSYETIQLFNDLELVIYNYIMKNSSQVQYMTIRELADAVHVSTSSIMRFCKKAGCDGYAEFRVKFKLYLESRKEIQPQNDLSELLHYFQGVHTSAFEEQISRAVDMVRGAQQVISSELVHQEHLPDMAPGIFQMWENSVSILMIRTIQFPETRILTRL